MSDGGFWNSRRVLVTGHTGFKGSWLSLMLQRRGAAVTGFSLPPPTTPSLFEVARVADGMTSVEGDVRDTAAVRRIVAAQRPDVVFHLAAQSLVRRSYADPMETYAVNVMGTAAVLDAVRHEPGVRAVVVITSDKCYEIAGSRVAYSEADTLGGYDPYSSSKACAELVVAAMRRSFFNPDDYARHGTAVASTRSGNVVGGGDWAQDRLLPDLFRAFLGGRPASIRNPRAVRPWQHVLGPLAGYLALAERLVSDGPAFAEAWNFGPPLEEAQPVSWIADHLTRLWGGDAAWSTDGASHPHEAAELRLDSAKAHARLAWHPAWSLETSLKKTADWFRAYRDGADMREVTLAQIVDYEHERRAATANS